MSLYLGQSKIKQVNVVFNDGVAADVKPSNIKTGIRILGVDGTYTGDGTQSVGYEVATSSEILEGHSAWVDGNEVLGELIINNYYTGSEEPSASLGKNGDIYLQQ